MVVLWIKRSELKLVYRVVFWYGRLVGWMNVATVLFVVTFVCLTEGVNRFDRLFFDGCLDKDN